MKQLTKMGVVLAGAVLIAALFGAVSVSADEDKSFDYNLYGYFKLDGAYDQNLTSHGNFVMWVKPQSFDGDDEQFNMTANQTRFGVTVNSKGYGEVKVDGKVEFDLYAGVSGGTIAENKPMLQLRHGYFTVQKGGTKLLAGQSWDLISPLNPTTLNYSVLWGVGNIGYRRAQVSLWQNFKAGETDVTIAGGAFRTIGSDLTPTFTLAVGETAEGVDDGTDAGIPSVQGLLDVKHEFASGASVRFGASGLWGQLKAETNLGNSETYETWIGTGHLAINFSKNVGILGEAYTGNNGGSYFAGIANSSQIDGVASFGAWGSLWANLSEKVRFSGGFGMDDPEDEDLGLADRSYNQCIYGNLTYKLVDPVSVGLEVAQWQTDYTDGQSAKSLRAQTSFVMNF
ncbi:hypothetical protein GF420_13710 [candidate division GN15 bacterium]|nr:hypothetical protein [candidate division GN15 bacterium]